MDKHWELSGEINFGNTATDYAQHRPGFPDSFFARLVNKGYVASYHRTLDIGTGTGTLARGFAKIGCQSIGLDPAPDLLREARKLAMTNNLSVEFVEGKAEHLPFEESAFDVVSAAQCWHWFDAPAASAEIARVLKPNGHLIIANFDWQPQPENAVQLSLELVTKHHPTWTPETRPGFFANEPSVIKTPHGFKEIEINVYTENVFFTHESWRGRMRASAAVGASMQSAAQIRGFDDELKQMLSERFPNPLLLLPHFVTTRVYKRNSDGEGLYGPG